MSQAVHLRLNALDARLPASAPLRVPSGAASAGDIHIAVHDDIAAIEAAWRVFEAQADGTVFQTVEYLSTWLRHVGARSGVQPAIVTGSDAAGGLLFLLPLGVRQAGMARVLEWLGSDLCDYNAPLLAADFSERFSGASFAIVWAEIARHLQSHPRLAYDLVSLTKMPERVGEQANPMLALGVTAHPSGAYLTHLEGAWDVFYAAKRSSTTRRRDRTKRKRLAELGEVRMVNTDDADILATLDILMEQKARSFARMGVANLFARPGYPEFYRALAAGEATRSFVHVSRLDVGEIPAAVNLGLIHRRRYYHLLASYGDGEASRFGPGAAHRHERMRYAIERGCDTFDFTIGDEPYQRDWCDTELTLYDHISAATLRGSIVAGPRLAGQRLKRWIKHTPVLWNAVSRARALLGSLRAR
jgi:CelD/BcsL family acetyltransferase involved in cellulose biosynthesis